MMKKKIRCLGFILLILFLIASIAQNIWYYSSPYFRAESYLQSTDEIYTMESGILYNNLELKAEEDIEIKYDFDNAEYSELLEKYNIEKTAGEGSEFERAARLMNEYAPRLRHKSNYDNHIDMNALALLEYSLDNSAQGINCRNKAQILNEMCLALGIYSRKVWIIPYSGYDTDCHVVNEVWDSTLNKWVMLDITNNEYWVDENGTPLSVMEIREKGAMQEFCTPVYYGENMDDLQALKQKHMNEFLYTMKNMVYIKCCKVQTVGETESVSALCDSFSAAPF